MWRSIIMRMMLWWSRLSASAEISVVAFLLVKANVSRSVDVGRHPREIEQRYDLAVSEPQMAERTLLNRIGEPSDIADAVEFLVSDKARYITGQKMIVDGGSFLY